jgi:hypothetical protein
MFLSRPTATYVVDTAIAALSPVELFVICVTRLWVQHHRHTQTFPAEWRDGFTHMEIERESEAGFDQLFQCIATAAIRKLDIRCRRCAHLGEDEGWLLQLVHLLQCDRRVEAIAILSDWLSPTAVPLAIGQALAFARGLAARGLQMPLHQTDTATAHPSGPVHHAGCSSALIH